MIYKSERFRKLIEMAKYGDASAFSTIYKEFFTPLYRYVLYRVSISSIAEDITQMTFIKTYEKLSKLGTARESSPMACLYKIASNLIIDYFRDEHPVVLDPNYEIADSINIEDEFEESEQRNFVNQVLNTLSPEQRDIIIFRYVDDLSYEDISKITNKSPDALRQLHFRTLGLLKKKLSSLNLSSTDCKNE